MNKKQKVYSVLQIKKYNSEIEQIEEQIEANQNALLMNAGIAICSFIINGFLEYEFIWIMVKTLCVFVGSYNIMEGIKNLTTMIYNISEKVGLENNISRIEYDMKMSKLEEKTYKKEMRK